MGLAHEDDAALWTRCLTFLIKMGCACLIAASLVYLALAGIHYAVISGLFSEAEVHGTRVIIAYALALFGLFLAAGVLGLWACIAPRRMPAFAAAALAPAAAIFAGVATSTFGVADSAFDAGFIKAFDLFFGVLALVLSAAAAAVWRLAARAEAASDDQGDLDRGADERACGEDAGLDDDTACFDDADEPDVEPADESDDVLDGEPADDPGDEPTGEPAGEPADEPADEPGDEPAGEPADEPAGEPVDEPADEPAGEPADEPVDGPVDTDLADDPWARLPSMTADPEEYLFSNASPREW